MTKAKRPIKVLLVKIDSPQQSELIQKIALDNGFTWASMERRVKFIEEPYLAFNEHEKLIYFAGDAREPRGYNVKIVGFADIYKYIKEYDQRAEIRRRESMRDIRGTSGCDPILCRE